MKKEFVILIMLLIVISARAQTFANNFGEAYMFPSFQEALKGYRLPKLPDTIDLYYKDFIVNPNKIIVTHEPTMSEGMYYTLLMVLDPSTSSLDSSNYNLIFTERGKIVIMYMPVYNQWTLSFEKKGAKPLIPVDEFYRGARVFMVEQNH